MKYLFSLALKNIFRRKSRTILTFLVLTLGIMFYIWMAGILKGADGQILENLIQFETGDLEIRSSGFREEYPYAISNNIKDYTNIMVVLQAQNYVKAVTERLNFRAELDNGQLSTPIVVSGINLESVNSVFAFSNFMVEGNLEKGGMVVSQELADQMELSLGDAVYLTRRDENGMINFTRFSITGVINTPNLHPGHDAVFINIIDAQKAVKSDSATEIAVKTSDYREDKNFQLLIDSALNSWSKEQLKVFHWEELGKDYMKIGQRDSRNLKIFLLLILMVAMAGIIHSMLIVVFEKKSEIGTLKALGMRDKDVRTILILEGMVIGALGSISGVILGALLNWYFVVYGLDFTGILGKFSSDGCFQIAGVIYSRWDIGSMVGAFILSLLFSTLASCYPADKAARFQAAECLRTVQ